MDVDEEKLKEQMAKCLSDTDIMDAMKKKCNLVLYSEIPKYGTIDRLLGPYKACVILYNDQLESGHWCCIHWQKSEPKTIQFFDPYNYAIDSELKWDKQHHQDPTLSRLISRSGYNVRYNDQRLQKMSDNIATCGRHCIVRLWNRDMFVDDYCKMIRKTEWTPDEVVTLLTIDYPKQ